MKQWEKYRSDLFFTVQNGKVRPPKSWFKKFLCSVHIAQPLPPVLFTQHLRQHEKDDMVDSSQVSIRLQSPTLLRLYPHRQLLSPVVLLYPLPQLFLWLQVFFTFPFIFRLLMYISYPKAKKKEKEERKSSI